MNTMKFFLDKLIERFEIIPVSEGYYELITRKEMVAPFVNCLSEIGIRIIGFDWWCFVDPQNPDCPHGGGGIRNVYGDSWFSEMYYWEDIEFKKCISISDNNKQYADYFIYVFPNEDRYLDCIVPGFHLDVPDDWQNVFDKR